jgi:hypothetical protein
MLPLPFVLASCAEVALVILERYLPRVLPLGGSHVAQLGVCFGTGFIVQELYIVCGVLLG